MRYISLYSHLVCSRDSCGQRPQTTLAFTVLSSRLHIILPAPAKKLLVCFRSSQAIGKLTIRFHTQWRQLKPSQMQRSDREQNHGQSELQCSIHKGHPFQDTFWLHNAWCKPSGLLSLEAARLRGFANTNSGGCSRVHASSSSSALTPSKG